MDEDKKGQPHDGLFDSAIAQIEDVRTVLAAAMPPDLVAALDLSRLERLPAHLVDPELRASESDALFEVPFRNHDVSLVIYVADEHQSQLDIDMPLRLHRATARLGEQQRLAMPDEIMELIEKHAPQSTYIIKRPGAQSILTELARYILRVGNGDYAAIRAQLSEAMGPELGEIVMGTVEEELLARGRVEGEARAARAEARERMLLVSLLEHKFGPLERGVLDRLANASIDSIEIFADRVLTAEKIEDVLKE